ncbi:14956_t:CDS:2 [Entrophospora sp. SA101]|nr:14956_t:CDS:2 [Entrophospora sp. SA101]
MYAYYHDNNDCSDPKKPHEKSPLAIVTIEELAHIGILYSYIEGEDFLDKIKKISDYKKAMGDLYDSKMKVFYEEHFHEGEEIRYILDDLHDKWIRIALTKGDLIEPIRVALNRPVDDNSFRKDYLNHLKALDCINK